MKRQIIKIDKELCNGCGLCVSACHEGAIGLSDGKAELLRDDYCDGLGNCLPVCPTGAITFEEREAAEYNEAEVKKNMEAKAPLPCGCPGSQARQLHSAHTQTTRQEVQNVPTSQLRQWPVQMKLVPVNAPYFDGAHLLVAADCAAYAMGNFHQKFMKNKITVIGCPKLDDVDYSEKLSAIIKNNNIKSVSVVRMEVPCCGGLAHMVAEAVRKSGKTIPWGITILSTDGEILED